MGVESGTLLDIRRKTRQSNTAFGHRNVSLEAVCHICYPLYPFFWVVEVSAMDILA